MSARTHRQSTRLTAGPSGRTDSSGRSRRGGFSLAEVLIALGILAIGLAMAAALIPASLKINEDATGHITGAIICQNADSRPSTVSMPDEL